MQAGNESLEQKYFRERMGKMLDLMAKKYINIPICGLKITVIVYRT